MCINTNIQVSRITHTASSYIHARMRVTLEHLSKHYTLNAKFKVFIHFFSYTFVK